MHIVIWGEGLSPVFVAQWLRKLSSTVDITILSWKDRLGYSINLLPLYAVKKLSFKELIPIPLKYVESVIRANVILEGYELDLSKRVVLLDHEKRAFDFLVLALNLVPFTPVYSSTDRVKCPWSLNDVREIRDWIDDVSRVVLVGDFLTSVSLYNLLKELNYECRIFVDDYSIRYLDTDIYTLITSIIGERVISKDLNELKRADLVLCSGYWRLPRLLTEIKLRVGRFGIMVDDTCLSSSDFIYVVGGCAEHMFSYGIRYVALSEGLHEVESLVAATNILGLKKLKLRKVLGSLCCSCGDYIVLTLGSTVKEAKLINALPVSVRLRGREPMDDVVVKVVIDRRSTNIIGIHTISPRHLNSVLANYAHFIGYSSLSIADLITTGFPSDIGSVMLIDPLLEALRNSWYKLLWQS